MQQWTLADATELRLLRAALQQTLDRQLLLPGPESTEVAERMAIVATELASNAMRHARSPAVVTLSRSRRTLILDVGDDLPSSAPKVAEEHPGGHGGRGLAIVQQLATQAGWYVAAGKKHVWAQFRISPANRRWRAPRIPVFGLGRFTRLFRRIGH